MKARLLILLLLLSCAPLAAQETDTIAPAKKRRGLIGTLYAFVKEFSQVDTLYVEPQHYNFTVMLQNTNTYEVYALGDKSGYEFEFAPKPSVKLGPYFGWRFLFLGYTVDFTHLSGGSRQDFNLSLYSNQIGLDLFYRKMGDDYRIRSVDLGKDIDTSPLHNVPFDGLHASIRGGNIYYIFNHRKFSYPAAYSQSTVQRRSAGSFLAGIGYTRHTLDIDWDKLRTVVAEKLGTEVALSPDGENSQRVKYTDIALSGGYAYNWVFARNWLLDASLSVAAAYKSNSGEGGKKGFSLSDFSFKNFNMDALGRVGVVWNNTKWYVGANTIFHSYNYHRNQISTNNLFGNVNIYVGFNFDRR